MLAQMHVLFFSETAILILRIIYNKVELFSELKCTNIQINRKLLFFIFLELYQYALCTVYQNAR